MGICVYLFIIFLVLKSFLDIFIKNKYPLKTLSFLYCLLMCNITGQEFRTLQLLMVPDYLYTFFCHD